MAAPLKRSRTSTTSMLNNPGLREPKRVKIAPAKPRRVKDVPKHQDLVGYKHAVAGHDGTMCDAGGELFVKPCTQAEVDFYESTKFHPEFAELIPVYCGSLALLDTTTAASIHQQLPDLIDHAEIPKGLKQELKSHIDIRPAVDEKTAPLVANAPSTNQHPQETRKKSSAIKTDRAIALLNASYGFKKPNIMDAKMGRQLWSSDASPDKKMRFDIITQSTTHQNFGFRIAGMQVFKGSKPTYKTPAGIEQASPNVKGPNEEGFTVYNKLWGRDDVKDSNLVESLKLFIFNKDAGIDEDLGKLVAGLFARDLRRVEEVLQKEESRMYSSSLLFVFEGDGPALQAAIEEAKAAESDREQNGSDASQSLNKRVAQRAVGTALRVDSGIGMDDEELQFVAEPVSIDSEFGDESGDDDEEFVEMSTFPHIYTLKMIDFAHSQWTPGLGPDEDVLLGVRSLANIFERLSDQ